MFKVGQKVVCIMGDGFVWQDDDTGEECAGPQNGEILTIDAFDGIGYLVFFKYDMRDGFNPSEFRPLDYAFVEEVIKQVQPEKQPA